jgi:hypothetical protein
MRTLAGGFQIDERCFVDPRPDPNRATVSDAMAEVFLAHNTFLCQALSARIGPEQCKRNRANGLYLCGKCTQEKHESMAALPARTVKRRKGDNPESPWRQNPIMIRTQCRKKVFSAAPSSKRELEPQMKEMLRFMAKRGNAQAIVILNEVLP